MHMNKRRRCQGALYRLLDTIKHAVLETEEQQKKQAQRFKKVIILQGKLGHA